MADEGLDALDYLEECIKEARHLDSVWDAAQDLEQCVKERLAAKGDKEREAAWDYVACSSNEETGLNLDEYKRRCGISELLYTPEQLKIDEAKEEERERRKKDEDDRRIALLVKEMEDAGSHSEWKDKGIKEERKAASKAIRNVDKWIDRLTDEEQINVRDAIKEYNNPTSLNAAGGCNPEDIKDDEAGIVLGYYDKASSGGRLGFQRQYHRLQPNPEYTIRLGNKIKYSGALHPRYYGIFGGGMYCDYIELVNGEARNAGPDRDVNIASLEFPNDELIPDEDKKGELVGKACKKIYKMGKWLPKETCERRAKEENNPALLWGVPRNKAWEDAWRKRRRGK